MFRKYTINLILCVVMIFYIAPGNTVEAGEGKGVLIQSDSDLLEDLNGVWLASDGMSLIVAAGDLRANRIVFDKKIFLLCL